MKQVDKEMPKVCFFGIYDPAYSRNRVLIRGFNENGYEVVHCRVNPREHKGVSKFFFLIREYSNIRKNTFDLVIVAFPGHTVMWLARVLFGRRIIFDAFVSLYNSNVFDRKLYSRYSISGVKDWILDWHSALLSKKVLLDTNAHIDYFSKTFFINKSKFIRVFVGSDDTLFYPIKKEGQNNKFIVHFHGTYIPLQGIEYIIEAANILKEHKDIVFNMIGNGQEYDKMRKLAHKLNINNINFIDKVGGEFVVKWMAEADVCLGIFGTTNKASMVIPNKVFEALASKKPVITMKSKAIEELFIDKEHLLFCRPGDSYNLAEKILLLKQDHSLRERIAIGGYRLFMKGLTPAVLVKHLLSALTIKKL